MPAADANQDMVLVPAETKLLPDGASWVVTFIKTLSSAADAANDRDWPKISSRFLWATGPAPDAASPTASMTIHDSRGVFTAALYPGLFAGGGGAAPVPPPSNGGNPTTPGTGGGGSTTDGTCFGGGILCVKAVKADPTTAQVTFTVSDKTKWVALGLGSSMVGTDMWIAWVSPAGTIVISDRYSSARMLPAVDAKQDLTLVPASSKLDAATGKWTATFTRKLAAPEAASDKDIVDGASSYIWAYGDAPASADPAASFDKHAMYGIVPSLNIFAAPTTNPSNPGSGGSGAINTPPGADNPAGKCFPQSPLCVKVVKSKTDPTLAEITYTVSSTKNWVAWGIGKVGRLKISFHAWEFFYDSDEFSWLSIIRA
jgi:hypothetical protein